MLFKNYVASMVKLLEEHPECGDFFPIFAKDDEGNGYERVHYHPSACMYIDDESIKYLDSEVEDDEESITKEDLNAVMVN